jgi:hypothetical protein
MKTKIITILILPAILLLGCASPAYLPKAGNIGQNPYGSYIKVKLTDKPAVSGELIAIDSTQLIVFNEYKKSCETIPMNTIRKFELQYAKGKNYGWTIPVFTLLTPFIHGFLSAFTLPANLVVTIAISVSGARDFRYNQKNTTFETLRMFARFPQGIPEGVALTEIKQEPKVSKKDF